MIFKKTFFLTLLILFSTGMKAQSELEERLAELPGQTLPDTTVQISTEFLEEQSRRFFADDSPIVRMLDSLYRITYFNDSIFDINDAAMNKYGYSNFDVPTFHDTVYAERIRKLNYETPIPMVYNSHIKNFIELYAVRKRGLSSRMMGMAYLYFPMFEELLDRYNIPLEMKYLAMVESALNPTAGSHMGAKGLWQFMYGTGKVYNLKVTSLVDDRFDPFKSTEAACQHMLDLYNIYEDWFLVLAAYNAGAGNVNRAIRRAGGKKNYWAIWPYLPKETRGYVPAFIAVNYVMKYAAEHNLYPVHPGIMMHGTDTVTVRELISFEQLNEVLGVPLNDLRFFNPQFKRGIIPASKENPYVIRIPSDFVGAFLNNEEQVYAYKTKKGIEKETLLEEVKKVSDRSTHTVRSGETLGVIAKKYRVSVKQLQSWNNMRSTNLGIGQKLVVYSSGTPNIQPGEAPVSRSTKSIFHTVVKGESLSVIASKYKCSPTDLTEWNNLSSISLKVGQKLRVYPPDAVVEKTEIANGKHIIYTVKSGDTLWDIARRYDGVTVEQIKKLNNLNSRSELKIGQKLKITASAT